VANIFTRVLVWPYEQWFLRARGGRSRRHRSLDYPRNTPYFRETLATAFDILRQRDPRRHKRVLTHVRRIMNFPMGYSGAGYIQHLKAYATSFQPPPTEAGIRKEAILQASMLIHEATHGLLYSRKIPYDARTREQIEQLCSTEEHRFLSCILTPESLAKVKTIRRYHPELYRKRWSWSLWQRVSEAFSAIQSKRKLTKSSKMRHKTPNHAIQPTRESFRSG